MFTAPGGHPVPFVNLVLPYVARIADTQRVRAVFLDGVPLERHGRAE